MTQAERLQAALKSSAPGQALRGAVLGLAADGCPTEEIQALLESLLMDLRREPGRLEADEDAVLDALDGLAGWCHVDSRL